MDKQTLIESRKVYGDFKNLSYEEISTIRVEDNVENNMNDDDDESITSTDPTVNISNRSSDTEDNTEEEGDIVTPIPDESQASKTRVRGVSRELRNLTTSFNPNPEMHMQEAMTEIEEEKETPSDEEMAEVAMINMDLRRPTFQYKKKEMCLIA